MSAQDAAHIVDSYTYLPSGLKASYCYYQTVGTCQKTTYIYDAYGHPWFTYYPDGTRDWVAYRVDDLQDYSQKRGGIGVTLTFDSLLRVTQRQGANTVNYTYDAMNRPVIIQENGPLVGGEWEEGYDRAGRLTSEYEPWITGTTTINGPPSWNTFFSNSVAFLVYGYDCDGNVTSFNVDTTKGKFGETITYDNLDHPFNSPFGTYGLWSDLYDFTGRRNIRTNTVNSANAHTYSFWSYDSNQGGLDLTQVFH